MMPLAGHTARLVLHLWTYQSPGTSWIHWTLLPQMMSVDLPCITDFLRETLAACYDSYAKEIAAMLTRILQDERLLGDDAFAATSLFSYFLCHARGVEIMSQRMSGPGLSSAVPTLLLFCQRQMCGSMAETTRFMVNMLVEAVVLALYYDREDNGSLSEHSEVEFAGCAQKLNLICICRFSLLEDLHRADERHLGVSLSLLQHLTQYARAASKDAIHAALVMDHLRRTGTRIWHDTLKYILAIQTGLDATLSGMKIDALKAWRAYGDIFR